MQDYRQDVERHRRSRQCRLGRNRMPFTAILKHLGDPANPLAITGTPIARLSITTFGRPSGGANHQHIATAQVAGVPQSLACVQCPFRQRSWMLSVHAPPWVRPNVVMESLAMGVPVIASRVGGIPEMLEDGVNGILCDPGDIDGFALCRSTSCR